MPLDWLNTPLDKQSVSDLIARKKRERAIETLRDQFQQQVPTVAQRLQLADLLVMAGRGPEAVPILIALGDEFAADGFVAKAVAILKRVERIAPGREELKDKLQGLVQQQLAFAPTVSQVMPRRGVPAFGMEEISDEEPDLAEAALAPEPQPAPAAPEPEAGSGSDPAAAADAPAVEPLVEAESVEDVAAEPVENAEPDLVAEPLVEAEPGDGEPSRPDVDEDAAEVVPEPAESVDDLVSLMEAEPAAEASTDGDVLGALVETLPPEAEAGDASAQGDTPAGQRIRSAFRRFLSSLPGTEEMEESAGGEAAEAELEASAEVVEADAVVASGDASVEEEVVAAASEEDADVPSAPAEETTPEEVEAGGEFPLDAPPEGEPLVSAEPEEAQALQSPPRDASATMGARLRGAFRKLFSGAADEATTPATAEEEEAGVPETDEGGEATEAASETGEADGLLPTLSSADGADAALTDEAFQGQVLDLIQDVLERAPEASAERPPPEQPADPGTRLVATPIFQGLSHEELMAVLVGLELQTFEPGDVVVTEGAEGDSLFILTTGSVRVFVRNPAGRNIEVARLEEGDFFGELSCLSGRHRNATVTAIMPSELLELGKSTLDEIAQKYPRVRDRLEEVYLQRASSPEAAAVRAVDISDEQTQQKAIEILESHFGQSRWDPRMRLRLAEVLWKAGKEDEAIPILIGLADELSRAGIHDKAIAILKKVEWLQSRYLEEVNLAPLKKKEAAAGDDEALSPGESRPAPEPPRPSPPAAPRRRGRPRTDTAFQSWLMDVVRDSVKKRPGAASVAAQADPETLNAYGRGLRASPLFEGFSEDELLAIIRGLRLISHEPGDVIVTQGEPGQSLFVLTTGTVNVSIRDGRGRDQRLCALEEGSFFGEISTLSGRPRTATVIAASHCELLELDRPNLERIVDLHPRVKEILEEVYLMRSGDTRSRGG